MTTTIGIDPGLGGAVAIYSPDDFRVFDMPVLEVKKKRWVSAALLADLLRAEAGPDAEIIIERVSARPGQGVTSMFNFGMGYGICQGVAGGLQMPMRFVTPQAWRKALGVPPGKDGSRSKALEMCPELAHRLVRVKDHGRADAILIATYGAMGRLVRAEGHETL